MRIGIDIDGVINDLERFRADYGSKFGREFGKGHMIAPEQYAIADAFGWETEKRDAFWRSYLIDMVEQKPRRFVKEILRKLKMEGHEIYILTARNNEGFENSKYDGMMPKFVENWLTKHYLVYDHIVYTNGNKDAYCKEHQIEVMVEDKPDNVVSISKNIPVICYDAIYNHTLTGEHIYRAYSWYDVYDCVVKIQEEKEKIKAMKKRIEKASH